METKASYLIVGSFVLALIAGLFVFVIWLAKVEVNREFTFYRTNFTGSVTGLQEGGVVRYRGIPVGSVRRMKIDPDNVEEVQVTIEVKSDTPIKEDTEASLETQGLTGVAYVQLSGGTQGSPPLKPKPGKKYANIRSRASQLEKVFSSAPRVLDNVNQLVNRANIALSERNLQAFSDTLDNIKVITGAIAEKGGTIKTTIDDADAVVRDLRKTAASLDSLVKNVEGNANSTLGSVKKLADDTNTRAGATLGSFKKLADDTNARTGAVAEQVAPAVTDLRRTAESINRLSTELEAMVAENRRPVRDFSAQGLYELTQFLTEARRMVGAMTRLTNKIEADPARFLFGDQQQGVQAK